jgi:hypothetical protein
VKQPYLVVYDYGTGGVWSYLRADSAAQIVAKFPALKVYESPPDWMTEAEQKDIAARATYDLDTAEADDPEFFGKLFAT